MANSAVACLELQDPMDDKLINELAVSLEHRNERYHLRRQNWVYKEKEFQNQLEAVLQKKDLAVDETTRLRAILDCQKNKRIALEAKLNNTCSAVRQMQQEIDNKDKDISMVKRELEEKSRLLHSLILENKQTADMCDAELPAKICKGACNMQGLQSEQEYKMKANAVPEAQNGMEDIAKHSPFSSPSRRRNSIASPATLAEDESNTSGVA
jgi:chromosome segregation ATPase